MLGELIVPDMLLSQIEQLFSNLHYHEKLCSVINGITQKDEIYFSEKLNLWFKVDMSYEPTSDIIIVTLTDITSEKKFSDKLQTALVTDSLTGLSNRDGLSIYLDKVLEETKINKKSLGLLILDIDNLKNVNDSLGEKEGDALIIRITNILLQFKNQNLNIFRFGGDEFVVVMSNLESEDDVAYITDDLYNAFQQKKVKLSGGISVYPDHTEKKR